MTPLVSGTTTTTARWPAYTAAHSAAHSAAVDAYHDAWSHNDVAGMARAELKLRKVEIEWKREFARAGGRS